MIVPLTRGFTTAIDDADWALVCNRNWHAAPGRNRGPYAAASIRDESRKRHGLLMHRVLMGLTEGDGLECDHINGDTLDNRRSNLRICTHAENARNRKSTVPVKGVREKRPGRWEATIYLNHKGIYLGTFGTVESARAAYVEAAIKLHGEFAAIDR